MKLYNEHKYALKKYKLLLLLLLKVELFFIVFKWVTKLQSSGKEQKILQPDGPVI